MAQTGTGLFRGLRGRVIALVLIAAAPAVGVIAYSAHESHQAAIERVRDEALRAVRLAAGRHDQLIAETRRLLILLARAPEVVSGDKAACNEFLGRFLTQAKDYANFGVIGLDGSVVCSALPVQGHVNLSDRAYFRRAITSRNFAAGDYQVGRITGVPSLNVGYAVEGEGGHMQAVVFAALPLTWLNELIAANSGQRDEYTLSLIGADGVMLGQRPGGLGSIGDTLPVPSVLDAIAGGPGEGAVEATAPDGTRRLFAYTTVSGLAAGSPVYVAASIPVDLAYETSERLLVTQLAVLAAVVAGILSAALWAGDALVVRPITRLAEANKRLAAGDFGARASVPAGSGELAELAGAFNFTAQALGEREAESRQHLQSIQRLNRLYAVLSGINVTILRIRNRDEMLAETCRIAAGTGNFRLAWIGMIDAESGAVTPVASAGPAAEYLRNIRVSARDDSPEGHGAAGVAIRQSRWVVCNDIAGEPQMAPWQEAARAHGLASCAAFPLRVEDAVTGVFVLYAAESGYFDDAELKLLKEVAADVSFGLEFIEKERRLQRLAYVDELTGLANRARFEEDLEGAIARAGATGGHVAVATINLSGFRRHNEIYGRANGDRIVKTVASYLAEAAGARGRPARLESAEFGLILTGDGPPEETGEAARRILEGFPKTVALGGEEIPVTVRMGVAFHPLDGDSAETLMKNATLARRAPKQSDANTFSFFVAEIERGVQERRRIEQELRTAIERDEFRLVYQPLIDIKKRHVVGLEALLRWRNWNLGDMPPGKFIPVAEQSGLIVPLGEWVFEAACNQAREWAARGIPPVKIGVNVAVRQLCNEAFAKRVAEIVESEGCDVAAWLGIEVTETELMENVDICAQILGHLRDLGLGIAIDDFGTGYSSLGYLRALPVDTLKVDYTFVKDIVDVPEAATMARTIVALAHGLGLRTVAEGVETREQLDMLEAMGCDIGQGFLFARPSAPEEIEDMLSGLPLKRRIG